MARSTFSGFNASVSGLFAAQRSLDVIGHNIANQNTDGYTRQKSTQVTASPSSIENGRWLGNGVKMDNIIQIRDELLDLKYRNELTRKGYWAETKVSLTQVEDAFGEPNANGITKALNGFYAAMDAVIKHSEDPTAKATFIENALTLTRYMNSVERRFETLISDMDEDVNAMVTQINSNIQGIADLNKVIYEAEINGGVANDLRDRRNILIDQLSEMADIRVNKSIFTNNAGSKLEKLQIEIGDYVVVDHDKYNNIETKPRSNHPLYDASQKYNNPKSEDLKNIKVTQLLWSDGQQVNMNKVGGKLGAMLQQRDSYGDPSMGHDTRGLAYYVRVVNEFTKSFATISNEIHRQGIDKNGDKGEDLFTISGLSKQIDARNITVNPNIINSVNKLAIGISKNESDNKNFQALYDIRNNSISLKIDQNINGKFRTIELGKGNPEDVIKSMITSILGVDAKEARDTYQNEVTLVLEADMNRMSVSSVSENEELTNMIKFQHAYNASARMITTIDEMIDVIVNRMGRVGL